MRNQYATRRMIERIREDVSGSPTGGNVNEVRERTLSFFRDAFAEPYDSSKEGQQVNENFNKDVHLRPEEIHMGQLWESLCDPTGKLSDPAVDFAEIAEATVHTGFPTIFTKAIHNKYIPAYEANLMNADRLVDEVDSTFEDEYVAGVSGSDEPELVPAGTGVPETQLTEKFVRIKNYLFQKSFDFDRHTLKFDKSGGQIMAKASGFGKKMGIHRHRFIVQASMDFAISATGGTADQVYRFGGTAGALYSTDHASHVGDGQSNNNLITTAFSSAGMRDAFQKLALMKDEAGSEYPVLGKQVLCSMYLLPDVVQFVKSPMQYDTTDRSVNAFGPDGISSVAGGPAVYEIIGSPVIDAESSGQFKWAFGDFPANMRWQWVQRPSVEEVPGNWRMNIVFSSLGQYWGGCAPIEYRNVCKSNATT